MSQDAEEVWKGLVAAALVGTERQAGPLAAGGDGGALNALLGQLNAAPPEQRVLDAAAALWLYRQAGQQAVHDPAPPADPCAPESRPVCGAAATRRLARLLGGEQTELLAEWVAALARTGQVVPPELAPGLLAWSRNWPDGQAGVTAVVGERGRWLAAQNPAWDYVLGATDSPAWETGSRSARLAHLRRLREADPDAARGVLNQTWPDENSDDRAAFLAVLESGLSMADEPFLEAALDDRRKEVRDRAADFLVRLPESRLVARMIARAQPLLALKSGLGGLRPKIEVTLPEACDKAMIRDGIDPKPSATLGEKAWWLCQMLGAIPPSHWCVIWKTDPRTLQQAAGRNNDWRGVLMDGWRRATERCRDVTWAATLVESWPQVAAVLPAAAREAYVLEALRTAKDDETKHAVALAVLWQCTQPWSRALSRAVLDDARHRIAAGQSERHRQLRESLRHFARAMDPGIAPEAAAGWPTQATAWPLWADRVDELTIILQFRHEMLKEIAP